jgi:hypothetical protein
MKEYLHTTEKENIILCFDKEKNKNQHYVTIVGAHTRQYSMFLYIDYFQNSYTSHICLEYFGKVILKAQAILKSAQLLF